jgi:hypothetical protein
MERLHDNFCIWCLVPCSPENSRRNRLVGLQLVCLKSLRRFGPEGLSFALCRPVESLHVFDHCPMLSPHVAGPLSRGSHCDMRVIGKGEVDGFADLNCLRRNSLLPLECDRVLVSCYS